MTQILIYRRITICSVIGNFFEKLLQSKIIDKLDSQQSKLQRCFTKKCSSMQCRIDLYWSYYRIELKRWKYPLYAVFIDTSKAFDVVWHASLLRKLHIAEVKDGDWKIIDEWYKQLTSRVKWNGHFSRAFTEEQRVRQRGYCHLYFTGFFYKSVIEMFGRT